MFLRVILTIIIMPTRCRDAAVHDDDDDVDDDDDDDV